MTATQALGATIVFTCVAMIVSSTEQAARFQSLAAFLSLQERGSKVFDRRVVFALIIASRIALALFVMVSLLIDIPNLEPGLFTKVAVVVLALLSTALHALRPVGGDGAEQLQLIVVSVASLCYILAGDVQAPHIAALYLSFQMLLSYMVTGFAKLGSEDWRRGDVLAKIFSTNSYGHPGAASLLEKYRYLNLAGTWAPIALFSAAPVFFLQPYTEILLIYLALAALFHFGTAIFMGLNNFFLTFPATYPCLIYSHQMLYEWVERAI